MYGVVLKKSESSGEFRDQLATLLEHALSISREEARSRAAHPNRRLYSGSSRERAQSLVTLLEGEGFSASLTSLEPVQAGSAPGKIPLGRSSAESALVSSPAAASEASENDSASHDPPQASVVRRPRSRFGLGAQVLLSSLLPAVVVTVVAGTTVTVQNQDAFGELVRDSGRKLAGAIGSSVDLLDVPTLSDQLASLSKQPGLGFVLVQSPVLDQFQSSRENFNALTVASLISQLDAAGEGKGAHFTDDATSYAGLEQDVAQRSGGLSRSQKRIFAALKSDALVRQARGDVQSYDLVRLGVYGDLGGRTFGPARPPEGSPQPRFTITVATVSSGVSRIAERTVSTLLWSSGAVLLVAGLLALWLSSRILTPIRALIRQADQISQGRLDRSVELDRGDELGDLGRSIERMRASLELALIRLRNKGRR